MSTIFHQGGAAPIADQGLSWEAIAASLIEDGGVAQGVFAGLRIASNFQPIFSLAHQRVVGFEGLMRAASETSFQAPLDVLARARDDDAVIRLDRLCRAVHLRNFVRHDTANAWLFLNVNPRVIAQGGFLESRFGEELERVGVPPSRVVIEILETALIDDSPLIEAARHYREMGCLIAIDDFGAGHSNFDRIARLCPDIVKLDRSIVLQAAGDRRIRALVPGMVSLLHESGSLVVMEGIETEQEAMIAMDADADFVQGRYFSPPAPWVRVDAIPPFGRMYERFRDMAEDEKNSEHENMVPYREGLERASAMLIAGESLGQACRSFLELPHAERCFLLDANGKQIGKSIHAPGIRIILDPRFAPLDDARGANWSRRHYFRRATTHPGTVQVTRPYLSIASAAPCITVSIAFRTQDGDLRVLCGDMRRDEHSPRGI
jgi:EAL domain-containing protein (putative c-di-GMP-specific phosphodiesterase class I)